MDILSAIAGIIPGLQTYLALAGAAVIAIVVGLWRARVGGRKAERNEAAARTARDVQSGRDALAKNRGRGTPDERVRRNDGDWE